MFFVQGIDINYLFPDENLPLKEISIRMSPLYLKERSANFTINNAEINEELLKKDIYP